MTFLNVPDTIEWWQDTDNVFVLDCQESGCPNGHHEDESASLAEEWAFAHECDTSGFETDNNADNAPSNSSYRYSMTDAGRGRMVS